ncbi:QacE family quaternary ammonium compound efflux SMR transporter [Shewanella sp. NFH-SH190041]|uniref:DMT family transporter n=1 Tax=Shewanella sp. NFH-SH190041 TaxID=2950245 RepID=UPI0021C330A6|nr:multidrug efflux SMR transporter [Shewanella sp. NFH-SH190041]BDM65442.1 QacE family quaternary ammonium compound efflux SMR transporter [Shewanella sp. NFH-SH190041]
MGYFYLAIAIVAEVIATSAMKACAGFTRPIPSILVLVGYAIAFYCLSLVLKTIPVGIAYAIWAGIGIVMVTLVAIVLYGQKPDLPAVIGMSFILVGVVIINLFSRMSGH